LCRFSYPVWQRLTCQSCLVGRVSTLASRCAPPPSYQSAKPSAVELRTLPMVGPCGFYMCRPLTQTHTLTPPIATAGCDRHSGCGRGHRPAQRGARRDPQSQERRPSWHPDHRRVLWGGRGPSGPPSPVLACEGQRGGRLWCAGSTCVPRRAWGCPVPRWHPHRSSGQGRGAWVPCVCMSVQRGGGGRHRWWHCKRGCLGLGRLPCSCVLV
jgi:hypothetical protein